MEHENTKVDDVTHENTKADDVTHEDTKVGLTAGDVKSDNMDAEHSKSAGTGTAELECRGLRRLRVKSSLTDREEGILHRTIGCALRVHRELGPGFLEILYRRALCIELSKQGIPFQTELPVNVTYANRIVGIHRIDLLVGGLAVVELKAVERIDVAHKAQVLSYLRAAGLRAGLLLNFSSAPLTVRRVLL
jgi:GxxExxY protein